MRTFIILTFIVGLFSSVSFAADIDADDIWLRESIPGQPHGAGFGMLKNNTEYDVFLIGGSVSIAEDVEIHQHVVEGEQMRMEQIEALMIPAQDDVRLQPGGYHVMLMNLTKPLVVGDIYELQLIFSDGTIVKVSAPVRPLVSNHNHHGH